MFDWASIVRPLGRCRIVAGEVNRDGKHAARRAAPAYTRSVHVHRAAELSSIASPALRRTHVSTANQVACVQFDVAAARRQQCAARRSPPHFFPTHDMIADFLTKAPVQNKLEDFVKLVGLRR